MPINLTKGQKVDLTKGNPGLKKIMVGLGWDVNAFDSGADFDLDAAAFMLGDNGKCPTEKEFIFYGNLTHESESVVHMGDNLTGEGEGDDEQIEKTEFRTGKQCVYPYRGRNNKHRINPLRPRRRFLHRNSRCSRRII